MPLAPGGDQPWPGKLSPSIGASITADAIGLKEHDRLTLARNIIERKLTERRVSARLPAVEELVAAKPLVSTWMMAKTQEVTPEAARRIVLELGLREISPAFFWTQPKIEILRSSNLLLS
ncbi:helix-turn-helix domain-containing protein [Rhizobium multihospitium]|uniref:helix-turn-helix domain-containing protein n=1 Tax=Rhizobium multihospitium TaxID=410764 RepID=UPI003CC99C06